MPTLQLWQGEAPPTGLLPEAVTTSAIRKTQSSPTSGRPLYRDSADALGHPLPVAANAANVTA